MRSKNEFTKSAILDLELLSVSDGFLHRKYVTQNGTVKNLLVVPEEISAEVLKQLHQSLAHAKTLRVKEIIFRHFFLSSTSQNCLKRWPAYSVL